MLAAVAFLSESGVKRIDLAGYSFGAWVIAHALQKGTPVERVILVSPPVGFMDFSGVAGIDRLKLVVTGSRDQIAPAEQIRKMLFTWNAESRFEVIEGADHFFGGYLDRLEKVLTDFI